AKALCGEIVDFTGIDLVYEKPLHPEVVLNTNSTDISECVSTLLSKIRFINL
ncbi:MAG: adenylyl-sulfate kinase, partial [Bacteroidota bacterium]|nr:adenylyl-sulfate kinase [Bacteroidota bacterium]